MKLSFASAVLGTLAVCAQAHATTISFDEFSATNNNAPLTTQYAAQGVVFGSDNSGVWSGLAAGDPGSWGVDGTNGDQFLGNNGADNAQTYVTTINFTTGMSGISFDTSRTLGSAAGEALTVEAFVGASELSTQTLTEGDLNSWTSVEVSGSGITELVLTDSIYGFSPYAIDNLSFSSTSAVPEPTNVALMLAGLGLGLAGVLRKRRAR